MDLRKFETILNFRGSFQLDWMYALVVHSSITLLDQQEGQEGYQAKGKEYQPKRKRPQYTVKGVLGSGPDCGVHKHIMMCFFWLHAKHSPQGRCD